MSPLKQVSEGPKAAYIANVIPLKGQDEADDGKLGLQSVRYL